MTSAIPPTLPDIRFPSAWEGSAASPGSAHKPSDKLSLFPPSTIGDLARQSSTHVSPAWLAPLDSTDCQDNIDVALANVLHSLKRNMFKISIADTPSRRTLIVEGTLIGPWIAELGTTWRNASRDL